MNVWLKAPNGRRIKGTSEILPGTADCRPYRDENGKVIVDYDDGDGTQPCWDAGETVMRDGQIVFVDDDGNEWLESELVPEDQECDPEYKPPERSRSDSDMADRHTMGMKVHLPEIPNAIEICRCDGKVVAYASDEPLAERIIKMLDMGEGDSEDLSVDQTDTLLDVRYLCPDCGVQWEERYSAACDSECDSCGADIQALMWKDADDEWTPEQNKKWDGHEEDDD